MVLPVAPYPDKPNRIRATFITQDRSSHSCQTQQLEGGIDSSKESAEEDPQGNFLSDFTHRLVVINALKVRIPKWTLRV